MNAPMGNRGRELTESRSGEGRTSGLSRLLAPAFRAMIARFDHGMEFGSLEAILPDGSRRMLGGRMPGRRRPSSCAAGARSGASRRADPVGGMKPGRRANGRARIRCGCLPCWDAIERRWRVRRGARGMSLAAKRFAHWLRRNHRDGSRRNIEFHYDLGNDFYTAWLDPGMTYSSALFSTPGQSLEAAQAAKLDAMLARTETAPGDAILEIGSGWGSFAEAAGRAGRRLHGITLSVRAEALCRGQDRRRRLVRDRFRADRLSRRDRDL